MSLLQRSLFSGVLFACGAHKSCLLSRFVSAADPDSRIRRSATFLPEVAHSEGWGISETLEHLIHKAGYNGRAEEVLSELEASFYC